MARVRNSQRKPVLNGVSSLFDRAPRVEIFLEPYSDRPELQFGFRDANEASECHAHISRNALRLVEESSPAPRTRLLQQEKRVGEEEGVVRGGISTILRAEQDKIKRESLLANGAFEDLDRLASNANDVVAIIDRFAAVMLNSSNQQQQRRGNAEGGDDVAQQAEFDALLANVGIVSNPVTRRAAGSRYHAELATEIAGFLSTRKRFHAMTLFDCYALYNRARGHSDLVSPDDFLASCRLLSVVVPSEGRAGFVLMEYAASGTKVIKNLASTGEVVRKLKEALSTESAARRGIAAAEFARSVVPSLPIAFAEEVLREEEERGGLAVDADPTGNLRYFPNLYFN